MSGVIPMPSGETSVSASTGAHRIVALAHFGFLLIGIVNTMLGPILPYLSARWHLDDSQAGIVLLAQPAGATLGSLLSGLLIKRFGFTRPLAFGFGLMAMGLVCLRSESWALGIIAIFGTGLALGLTIPTINLLVSEINPGRRAAALNLLNLVWGLGAVTGPLLISALTGAINFTGALVFLAALATTIFILMFRRSAFSPPVSSANDRASASGAARARIGMYPFLTGALVFVNVGTESAAGGWIATYVQRLTNLPRFSWALAPSLFWAGMFVGRAAAPLVLRRLAEARTILTGMFIGACGLLVILLSAEPAMVFVGIGLAGFGLAPIFPTTIALFTERFGSEAPQLTGILFLLAGLGAAIFPWLVGLLSSHFNGLRAGLLVPLIGSVVMIALQIAIMSTTTSKSISSK